MFRLFEKKRKKEEMPVMWQEEVKMTEFIIFMMSEYLKKCQGDIVLVKEEPGLQTELDRLKKIGLGNSENAKLLISKITDIENRKERCEFGKGVVEFIKTMSTEFPGSYLISFDQFFEIIQKYHLYCRPIGKYHGIIPSKNIEEIEVVKDKLLDWSQNCREPKLPVNYFDCGKSGYDHFWYVSCIKYRSGRSGNEAVADLIEKYIEKYGSIVGAHYSSSYSDCTLNLDRSEIHDVKFNSWLSEYKIKDRDEYSLDLDKLKATDLLIAAPKDCFAEEYKVKEMPVDPIVFQYSPFGVVVHSVWGEEADDKVLAEYRELNKSILG